MSARRRYALVGAGAQATMYLDAIAGPYEDAAELVGLCDSSRQRMAWHNRRLERTARLAPRPAYAAEDFDRMNAETRPDTVIVATIDATHHVYITRAAARASRAACVRWPGRLHWGTWTPACSSCPLRTAAASGPVSCSGRRRASTWPGACALPTERRWARSSAS